MRCWLIIHEENIRHSKVMKWKWMSPNTCLSMRHLPIRYEVLIVTVATSITHIHVCNKPIIKMMHHAVNVTSIEAELFAIIYGINQAVNLPGISEIVIITDSIHVVKRIFNSSIHFFQTYSASIFKKLRKFFLPNNNDSIAF